MTLKDIRIYCDICPQKNFCGQRQEILRCGRNPKDICTKREYWRDQEARRLQR